MIGTVLYYFAEEYIRSTLRDGWKVDVLFNIVHNWLHRLNNISNFTENIVQIIDTHISMCDKRLKLMIFEGFLEKGKGVIGAIVVRRLKERGEKAIYVDEEMFRQLASYDSSQFGSERAMHTKISL